MDELIFYADLLDLPAVAVTGVKVRKSTIESTGVRYGYANRDRAAVPVVRGGVNAGQRPGDAPFARFKYFVAGGLPRGQRAAVSGFDVWQLPHRAAAVCRRQQKLYSSRS